MAATSVSTSVTELPESRVRVDAEIPPEEVEKRVAQAAKALGRSMRVPGFRAGKAPAPVVIKRVGREAVLDEAVRGSIGDWYSAAIDDAAIVPVGEPELDLGELPSHGQPLNFSIEIGVRPEATLGEYKGLTVEKAEPGPSDEAIDAEVEQLRERSGRLETVERPAAEGDFVVMDYAGSIGGEAFAGGEGRDQMIELGSGRLVPGFEEQLTGASAGDERTVQITFPDDYGAEELAGNAAEFAVTVKEVKAKELPAVDDDLAAEAGFDTLDELRDDIRERLAEGEERRVEAQFREAVLDAAVDNATVEVPDALVAARSRELWDQMLHSLSHQGISKEMYLQISGPGGGGDHHGGQGGRGAPAQARGGARRGCRGGGDRAVRGGGPRGAGGGRAVRGDEREEAARPHALGPPARHVQGRAGQPQGARPAGRIGHPDTRATGVLDPVRAASGHC